MTNNFVKDIERYLLESFSKKEGNFGHKPLMHRNTLWVDNKEHERLKMEGLIYLENEAKEAVASIHPKRGITFIASDIGSSHEEENNLWQFTIRDKRTEVHKVKPSITTKGVAVLGEIDLRSVFAMEENTFYFSSYDNKCHIEIENHRNYPDSIYAAVLSVKIDGQN